MDAVWVAAIVAIAGVGTTWLTGRQRRADKREDWERQDEVAARLLEVNEKVAAKVEAVAVVAAETKVSTDDKLKVIHTLVNSQMTAAKRNELDASIRSLASLEELIDVKRSLGHEPTAAALRLIEDSKKAILSMEVELAERQRAQDATRPG